MNRVAYCTLGCRLNQYDTETVRTLLDAGGYRSVALDDEADVYVVNTCSVTARADATSRKAIRRLHERHPDARIVVTGCYAQRAPGELAALEGVSLVLGAADRGRIVEELGAVAAGEARTVVSPVSAATEFLDVPITEMMEHSRAYVKVQEGCNESCSFCIVPQTRGRSRSREPASVLRQVEELVDSGYVEVVVTGVHVGDYGLDLPNRRRLLPRLLRDVLAVRGVERLRLSSIEPASITPELVELMAGEPRFARHFHIPFQSGSDAVLERMRRRYTAGHFSDLVTGIAGQIPDCGIGADVICGFPGETDADFQRTFDCLVDLPITYLHPFTYSERPGSEAQSFPDQVPGDVRKRRTRSLKRLGRDKNLAARARHVGRRATILAEPRRGGGVAGWTDNYLRVDVPEATGAGGLVEVEITRVTEAGLEGRPR